MYGHRVLFMSFALYVLLYDTINPRKVKVISCSFLNLLLLAFSQAWSSCFERLLVRLCLLMIIVQFLLLRQCGIGTVKASTGHGFCQEIWVNLCCCGEGRYAFSVRIFDMHHPVLQSSLVPGFLGGHYSCGVGLSQPQPSGQTQLIHCLFL